MGLWEGGEDGGENCRVCTCAYSHQLAKLFQEWRKTNEQKE